MRLRRISWLAPMLLVLACNGTAPATNSPPPTVAATPTSHPPTTATPETASPAPSATSALTSIPTELQGTWQATASDGKVTLTFGPTSYRVRRTGEQGQGSVHANGDLLQFSNGTLCALIGTYAWSLTNGTLTFMERTEQCPGRLPSLNGLAYTRLQ